MVNWVPLSPLLALLVGALANLFAGRHPRARYVVSCASILAAAALLVVNAQRGERNVLLFVPAAAAPEFELVVQHSPLSLLFSLLLLNAVVARLLLQNLRAEKWLAPGTLVALAGAVAFVSAGNWATLAAGWLLADAGLLIGQLSESDQPARAWRAFAVSQTGALLFLVAGMLVSLEQGALLFDDAVLSGLPAALVLVAAWMRSGLYPFHFAFSGGAARAADDSLWTLLLPAVLGINLLSRALVMLQGEFAYADLLQICALLGLGATTLLVLREVEPQPRLTWVARAVGAPIFFAVFVGVASARAALALWLMLGLFNCALLAASACWLNLAAPRQPWAKILWGAALLAASGFPLTASFVGRAGLYVAAVQDGHWLLLAAFAVATTLVLIPLWRVFFETRAVEIRRPTLVEYAGLLLLLVPLLAEGFAPFAVVSVLGRVVQDASVFGYDALFKPQNMATAAAVWAALVLPLPFAFFLARGDAALYARLAAGLKYPARALELSGLVGAGARVVEALSLAARQVSALMEQHPVGWFVFAALWLALWLLNVR